MARQFGEWYEDGDWYVRHEKTTKPFRQARLDATRGLAQGLSGLLNTHEWHGQELHVHTLGVQGIVTYEPGELTCKVKIGFPATFLKEKILSDVGALTVDVAGSPAAGDKDVFIVHGHNDAARRQLSSIVSDLGLNPVVLVEENDLSYTIIEKFEYYARNASFAFILMTPDDQAQGLSRVETQWRARQNVIMELGWFMGYLGRRRVAILLQGDLEIPSDILGMIPLRFEHDVSELTAGIKARLLDAGLIES